MLKHTYQIYFNYLPMFGLYGLQMVYSLNLGKFPALPGPQIYIIWLDFLCVTGVH